MVKRKWEDGDEETSFCNVDLDILSRSPLDGLVAAFGRKVLILYVSNEGPIYEAHLELAGSYWPRADADAIIRKLVALVKKLPPSARRVWTNARSREFNIGIQAGLRPHSHEIRLAVETLAAVASVGGRIVITTYAPDLESSKVQQHHTKTDLLPNRKSKRPKRRNASGPRR